MSRFFLDSGAIDGATARITDPEDIRHIIKVLRLSPGDELELSDGTDFEYKARIVTSGKDAIELAIIDKQGFSTEPTVQIHLYQGMPKQGKMETIVQKAVELGVHAITPVFTSRSVVTEKRDPGHKTQRWQKIADEAVKQCRRGIIPAVHPPIGFDELLLRLGTYDLILFPYENERNTSIKDVLRNRASRPISVAVIIGPEGGFTESEADRLGKAGAASATLGRTTLRTETAGIVAISMILYELEL